MHRAWIILGGVLVLGCGATRDTHVDVSTDRDAPWDLPDRLDPAADMGDATDSTGDPDMPMTALMAEGASPITLDPEVPGCTLCEYARPSVVWDGSSIHMAYESDEDVHDRRIRMARLDVSGGLRETPAASLVDTGEDAHAYSAPALALTGDSTTPLAAVWMDQLGGARLSYLEFDVGIDPIATGPGWLMDPAGPVAQAATPSIAPGDGEVYSAFVAEASGASSTDVFVARFVGGTLDATFGTDGFVQLSETELEDEEGRPALDVVSSVVIAAWATPGRGLRAATTTGSETRRRDVPLPGIFGSVSDIVIVHSPVDETSPRAFILFSAIPEDVIETEIYAVSVNVSYFNNGTFPDGNVFGDPVRISDSPDHSSRGVAACWHGGATGVLGLAWNDRRTGRRIWFRLLGGLDSTPYPASEEIDMSGAPDFDGSDPSAVCITSQMFGVTWSSGTDLFYRRVVPAT